MLIDKRLHVIVNSCARSGSRCHAPGGHIRTTLPVLTDSIAANVAREVAANESMLMGEPAPHSKAASKAFISAACPLSPENEVVDFFRPPPHSTSLKSHIPAVFASPNTSRYSYSTPLAP